MSKFKWKELPDWENVKDYDFLENAPSTVWAWEFLRRSELYRQDWKEVQGLKEKYGDGWLSSLDAYKFFPDLLEGDTEATWVRRTAMGSTDPLKIRIDEFYAEKWCLKSMIDPLHPLPKASVFSDPYRKFPKMILHPDQFERYVGVLEYENGEELFVQHELGILAFDLTIGLDDQLKRAGKILKKLKSRRVKAGTIEKQSYTNSPEVWKRYLRVLDARRSNPYATHKRIAETLNDYDGNKDPYEVGKRYYKAAVELVDNGYRHILKYTPPKK